MSDAAQLLRDARTRQGITQEQLGIRSGLSPATIADAEAGRLLLDVEQLADVLFVCGLQLEQADGGRLSVRPLELDVDPEELRYARSLSMADRLRSAFGWNSFADRVARAGERAPP